MAKKFFYVCAGLCLLVLSFEMGASTVKAQVSGNSVVAAVQANTHAGTSLAVFTANGDVYIASQGWAEGPYTLGGNVFNGSPVPVQQSSWGALKVKAR